MKKKLLLVTAAAMMLVSCGGGNQSQAASSSENYVAEPETKAEMKKTDASAKLKTLSGKIATTKALGVNLVGDLDINATVKNAKTEENGLPKDLVNTIKFSAKELSANIALSGFGTGSLLGSAKVNGKLTGSVSGDTIAMVTDSEGNPVYDSEENPVMSFGTMDEKLDTELAVKSYIDAEYAYVDAGDAASKLTAFASKVGQAFGQEGLDIPDNIVGKVKTPIKDVNLSSVATLNVTVSTSLLSFSAQLDAEAALPAIPAIGSKSTESKMSDYFTFKEYTDNTFGVTADMDLGKFVASLGLGQKQASSGMDIGEAIGVGMDNVMGTLLNGLKGNVKAVANFNENAILSAGVTLDINYKLAIPDSGTEVTATAKGGFKVTFAYNDDVKVEQVTDKDSYKEVETKDDTEMEEGEEGEE